MVTDTQLTGSNATITLLAKGSQISNSLYVNNNLISFLDISPSDGSFGTVAF